MALPAAILNYVRRSREPVLLMDAAAPHPFSADPYFAQRHPKSVLCLPILRQSALIGVLYLENNLATHAFPPDRVKVLELLASQAAISLENAQLYTDLQQENSERKRAEETCAKGSAHPAPGRIQYHRHLFLGYAAAASATPTMRFLHMIGYRGKTCCPAKCTGRA